MPRTVQTSWTMRRIDELIIHCSATRPDQECTVSDIDRWHRERGFSGIGYHYVIYRDGTVVSGRPLCRQGAHCTGHNANSVGICYVGGLDSRGRAADTRTPAQKAALLKLLRRLKSEYPGSTVHGHSEFAAKECPCFDAAYEYRRL